MIPLAILLPEETDLGRWFNSLVLIARIGLSQHSLEFRQPREIPGGTMPTVGKILDADKAGKLQVFVYCGEIHLIADRKIEIAVPLSPFPRVAISDSNGVKLVSGTNVGFRFQAADKQQARALASVLRRSLLHALEIVTNDLKELGINPGQMDVTLPME